MFRPKTIDATQGAMIPQIILFAIPLTLTNVLQLLFQATDLIVLGQFADKGSMASINRVKNASAAPMVGKRCTLRSLWNR